MNRRPISPLHFIYEKRFPIVRAIFYTWLIMVLYWLYSLRGIECVDIKCLKFAYRLREGDEEGISARSALAFILWTLTSGAFFFGAVVFIVKFAYNCIMDTLKGVLPRKTQDFVVPVVLIVSLWPCFAYRTEIKSAYWTLSAQTGEIVTMALGYEVKLKNSNTHSRQVEGFGFQCRKRTAR